MNNKNLLNSLNNYCLLETEDFKKSEYYYKLLEVATQKSLNVKIDFGNGLDSCFTDNYYLSIEICDCNNELVQALDEGNLTTSTCLIQKNKNGTYRFYEWYDDELIDEIDWIIAELKKF
ncbi:MAG TPA: hypothetical protein PLT15_05300 [Bacilli bacterium]|nr:hypothetical protein [Bacilli bacterium]